MSTINKIVFKIKTPRGIITSNNTIKYDDIVLKIDDITNENLKINTSSNIGHFKINSDIHKKIKIQNIDNYDVEAIDFKSGSKIGKYKLGDLMLKFY